MTKQRAIVGKIAVFTPHIPRYTPRPPLPPLPTSLGVPFFRDKSHTIPTKWSLYRPLIKALGGATAVRAVQHLLPKTKRGWRFPHPEAATVTTPAAGDHPYTLAYVREVWRRYKSKTSLANTRDFLQNYTDFLYEVNSRSPTLAAAEARHAHKTLQRALFSASVAAHRRATPPKSYLTGGLMFPSPFWPPLPRLKPQPLRLTMMIRARIRRKQARVYRFRDSYDSLLYAESEAMFWKALNPQDDFLQPTTPIDRDTLAAMPQPMPSKLSPEVSDRSWRSATPPDVLACGWDEEVNRHRAQMRADFVTERKRSELVFDHETLGHVKEARRRRDVWWKFRAAAKRKLLPKRPLTVEEREVLRLLRLRKKGRPVAPDEWPDVEKGTVVEEKIAGPRRMTVRQRKKLAGHMAYAEVWKLRQAASGPSADGQSESKESTGEDTRDK